VPVRLPIAMLVLAAVLTACGQSSDPGPDTPNELEIHTDNGTAYLTVEIADTDTARQQGLMGRTSLGEDRGMAFLWHEPVQSSFWMKDTLIPLSIAFWDERGRIIALADMRPCRSDPCPTYGPDEPFVGAVEANLGFFEDNGVEVGDRVELLPNQ
jgi:uncharacterized membrane protein (UPF0127 family)